MALFTSLSLLAVACAVTTTRTVRTRQRQSPKRREQPTPHPHRRRHHTRSGGHDTSGRDHGRRRRDRLHVDSQRRRVSLVPKAQVNIVAWPGYIEDGSTSPDADWVTPFVEMTGCAVNVKLGCDE